MPSSGTFIGSASTGGEHLHHASDYFQTLYDWAEHLIRAGLAYVDDTPPRARCGQCVAR